eukprot:13802341-Alexandrium_andersonii.AAC.1
MSASLVGSEMCIRDRCFRASGKSAPRHGSAEFLRSPSHCHSGGDWCLSTRAHNSITVLGRVSAGRIAFDQVLMHPGPSLRVARSAWRSLLRLSS